jgi:SAM-dependent methyltransferase
MSRSEKFDKIYNESHWGYKSGPGSDPDFAKPWIDIVNSFLEKNDVSTVIDVGCGDWRIGKHLNLEGKDYTGVEVSTVMFSETVLNSADNIKFINGDFQTLDIHHADLIIIKDVLQHLSNSSIYTMINKIMEKSRYALFCDDMLEENNIDDFDGGYRGIDISADPFNFNFERLGAFGDKVISLYTRDGENNGGIS